MMKESSHPELPTWDRTEDFCDMLRLQPVVEAEAGRNTTILSKG
jgi:hypothetical protein